MVCGSLSAVGATWLCVASNIQHRLVGGFKTLIFQFFGSFVSFILAFTPPIRSGVERFWHREKG